MVDQLFKATQLIGIVGAACLSGQKLSTSKREELVTDCHCQDIFSVSAKLEYRHWLLRRRTFGVGNSRKCIISVNQHRQLSQYW